MQAVMKKGEYNEECKKADFSSFLVIAFFSSTVPAYICITCVRLCTRTHSGVPIKIQLAFQGENVALICRVSQFPHLKSCMVDSKLLTQGQ